MPAADDAGSARKNHHPVVFISSTAEDLGPYREAARDAALEAGFHPLMFEYFEATTRNPPLEECLNRVSCADLLVVIVAHRSGWIPPGQTKTITRLECERAASEHKDVLAFVVAGDCDWPAHKKESYRLAAAAEEGNYTPELAEEVNRNIASLRDFKQWLTGLGIRKTFANPDDLRGKIAVALLEWLDDHPEFAPVTSPPAASDPRRYLEDLHEQTAWIDIRGLQVGAGKAYRFRIEQLYTPLSMAAQPEEPGARTPERAAEAVREAVPLIRALAERRLVVVGDPGAGKTTFLRRVAAALCRAWLGESPPREEEDLGLEGRPFPLLIRVPELAGHIHTCRQLAGSPGPTTPEAPGWLADFLATQNTERNWGLGPEFFRRRLESDSTLLLPDGLDEPADRTQRESMARLYEAATRAYPRCRFVVTTRPLAYEGKTVLAGFRQARIEPLEPKATRAFLEHWCAALFPDVPRQAGRHLADLSEALRARAEIRRMARNPVMLTALAVVHWNERRLPEQRADLYDSILTWLARSRKREEGRESADRCLLLFQHLALAMQDDSRGRQVQISRGPAAHVLAPLFPESSEEGRLRQAYEFLTREGVDSGIITSRGSELRYWHLTFQEYLAARAIAGKPDPEQHALLLDRDKIYRPEWRETARLLAGVLRVKQGPGKVDAFVSALLDALGDRPALAAQARCAGLLGATLRDLQPLEFHPADPRCQATLDAVLGVFDARKAAGTSGGHVDFVAWASERFPGASREEMSRRALEEGWRILRVLAGQYIDGRYTGDKPPTVEEMFRTYAPSPDGNDPAGYARFVAGRLVSCPA